MRWNTKVQTDWLGDYPTADDALAALQARFEQGDSSAITKNKIEGSLDIAWMNFERPAETPVYSLHFLRYEGFKNGAQRSKEIIGKQALKTYLRQLGFGLLRAYAVIEELRTNYSVDLPNVMMAEYEYDMAYRN